MIRDFSEINIFMANLFMTSKSEFPRRNASASGNRLKPSFSSRRRFYKNWVKVLTMNKHYKEGKTI